MIINKKEKELVNTLFSYLDENDKSLCEAMIDYLLESEYSMKKCTTSRIPFAIMFEKPNHTSVCMGYGKQEHTDLESFLFMYRFSASENYSEKFQKSILNRIKTYQLKKEYKGQTHFPLKPVCGECTLCKGNPIYYKVQDDNGKTITHCAGSMMNVMNLTVDDIPEIKRHIKNKTNILFYK